MKKAILVLEDKTVYKGIGFGRPGTYKGELVFNTAMTGYMEALTDPSYAGQILTFAYPLIGNYGATALWGESKKIHPKAIVVHELCDTPIHRDSEKSLEEILTEQKIGIIAGIDTRQLIKKLRNRGTAMAVLFLTEADEKINLNKLNKKIFKVPKLDLVKQVTRKTKETINPKGKTTIALIDYGAKQGQINELVKRGAKLVVYPATVKARDVLKAKPDGVFLSNGPGDPSEFTYAHNTIKDLLKSGLPIMGICLGHQLLANALGAKTYKLKFGHRGINHPVMDLETKKSYLSSQNHGYAVDAKTLPKDWQVTFINLNDDTVEGMRHKDKPIFSVQFHPEANPGPQDTSFLFDTFMNHAVPVGRQVTHLPAQAGTT